MPLVLKRMHEAGVLHGDAATVTGRTIGEHAARGAGDRRASGVVRPLSSSRSKPTGGFAILRGNIAPDGCVVKLAGPRAARRTPAPRACSTARRPRWRPCSARRSREGDVVVIRGEGPAGGPGHARDAGRHGGDRRRGAGGERRADHRRALLRGHPRLHGRPRRTRGRHAAARSGRSPTAIEITIDVDARTLDVALIRRADRRRGWRAYAPAAARRRRTSMWRSRSTPSSSAAPPRAPSPAEPRARPGYSARKSRSSALKAAGRSSIAMWPVSSKITLRESGISSAKTSASRTLISRSLVAPHDQRRAGDLGQALAEVVVEDRLERLQEAGLAGAAQLLGGERRGQAAGVARRRRASVASRSRGAARDGVGLRRRPRRAPAASEPLGAAQRRAVTRVACGGRA